MGRARTWTRETVAVAIRKRHEAGTLGRTWRENASLRVAAHKRYGSWGNALSEVLGIAPPVRRTWSRERIVAAIRDRHRDGASLRRTWDDAPLLYSAAKRYFGTWHAAAAAAGFELPRRRIWTEERVVAELQSRHRRGERCTSTADPGLYVAALRHFDGWGAALAAAGVPSAPPVTGRRWSPELVLSELRRWHEIRVVNVARVDPALPVAAHRFFGGLRNARAAAGLEPIGVWTNRRIVEAVQDRHVRGLPIGGPGDVERGLASAARFRFGGWRAALEAAGLGTHYRPPPGLDLTSEGILAAIRELPQRNGRLTVGVEDVRQLARAASRAFGTWREAVLAAGLQPLRHRWTRESIVAEVRRRHAAGEAVTSHRNGVVATAARRFFPNWSAVLEAAGIEREVGS